MRKRFSQGRAPLRVTLLAGTAATLFTACSRQAPEIPSQMTRPVYASQDACIQDWDRPEHCEPAPAGTSGGAGGGYYGPYLYRGYAYHPNGGFVPDVGQARHATGQISAPTTESVARSLASRSGISRGGLGSTGRMFSMGG